MALKIRSGTEGGSKPRTVKRLWARMKYEWPVILFVIYSILFLADIIINLLYPSGWP